MSPAGSAASRQLVGERAGYRSVEREVGRKCSGLAFADKREILSSATEARHEFS